MSIERYDGRVVVRKVPLPGDERDRHAEALWLGRAGGRGVVELVTSGAAPVGIVTVHAGSHTWRTSRPDPVRAAPLLASALRTLAELHRRDLVHGAVTGDHLVVAGESLVLCSPDPAAGDPDVDRGAVAELVVAAQEAWRADGITLPPTSPWPRVGELLSNPNSGWSLDDIAALLSPAPGSAARHPHRGRGGHRRIPPLALSRPAAVASAVVVLGAGAVGALAASAPSPPAHVDVGGPAVELDGVRYRAGVDDDVLAATGRPCPGSPPAAVLEPASGTVWAFRRLPDPAVAEGGQPVQQVPGASDLVVRDEGSCQRLVVAGPDGEAPVPLPEG